MSKFIEFGNYSLEDLRYTVIERSIEVEGNLEEMTFVDLAAIILDSGYHPLLKPKSRKHRRTNQPGVTELMDRIHTIGDNIVP